MVILGFRDGHIERHANEVLRTLYAATGPEQVVTILTPEEVAMFAGEGLALPLGYDDPRKETN